MEGFQFDYHYRVVVVGCSEETRASSTVVVRIQRQSDGARVRLQLWDCCYTSRELPKLLDGCAVVVLYYQFAEQLERYMDAIKPSIPTAARLLRVCINTTANVGNAPYYFPCEDPAKFFSALDGSEDSLVSNVFWQEAAAGLDYRLMAEEHRIEFTPSLDFTVNVSNRDRCRCSANCLIS